jgi:hypothetical protein
LDLSGIIKHLGISFSELISALGVLSLLLRNYIQSGGISYLQVLINVVLFRSRWHILDHFLKSLYLIQHTEQLVSGRTLVPLEINLFFPASPK